MTLIARFIGLVVVMIIISAVGLNLLSGIGADKYIPGSSALEEEIVEPEKDGPKKEESPLGVASVIGSASQSSVGEVPSEASLDNFDREAVKRVSNPTIEEIKEAISSGYSVVGYVDTSVLKNPYYSFDGGLFVTIIGYTETHFTTVESGIRSGGGFVYLISDFMNALNAGGGQVLFVK